MFLENVPFVTYLVDEHTSSSISTLRYLKGCISERVNIFERIKKLILLLSEELPHSLGPLCSVLNLEFRPRLGLYFGETHNSRWEIYAHGRRLVPWLLLESVAKNNPIGNVFSRSFTALSGNLGATTLCQEAGG